MTAISSRAGCASRLLRCSRRAPSVGYLARWRASSSSRARSWSKPSSTAGRASSRADGIACASLALRRAVSSRRATLSHRCLTGVLEGFVGSASAMIVPILACVEITLVPLAFPIIALPRIRLLVLIHVSGRLLLASFRSADCAITLSSPSPTDVPARRAASRAAWRVCRTRRSLARRTDSCPHPEPSQGKRRSHGPGATR